MRTFTHKQYPHRGAVAFTEDEIWDATQALVDAKIPISIRAVQEKLGVRDIRGSARTIGKTIREWADETLCGGDITPMPNAVREALWYWVSRKGAGRQAKAEWRKVRLALDEWVRQEAQRLEALDQTFERFYADLEREARELATS